MNIKKITIVLFGFLMMLLVGCSGSDVYRGSWKAMDANGTKLEMFFEAKSFTVKDSTGKIEKLEYTQNSVKIENSVKTYGIKLKDGRGYQINFPKSNDENFGLIKDENDNIMYTIGRKNYIKYEDIFKLK